MDHILNPTREQLLRAKQVREFIRKNPGCNGMEINENLGLKSCHVELLILLDRNAILRETGRTYTIRKV